MKKIIIIPLLIIGFAVHAIPEKIHPKTKILRPVAWYKDQVTEWQKVVQHELSNADAWLNLFVAAKFAQESDQQLDGIVNSMNGAIPNTFEYYLIRGWHAGFTPEAIQYLNKAYEINPTHSGSYGL